MKTISVGELNVNICEHQGDLTYERFVKFKQYVPQFWESMDSPLFTVYFEAITDLFNKGQYMEAYLKLKDYKIAIDNSKKSYDAWGVCFALIAEIKDGSEKDKFKTMPNDADMSEKMELFFKEGLKADVVRKYVMAFMEASPEVFSDHLTMFALQGMIIGEQK